MIRRATAVDIQTIYDKKTGKSKTVFSRTNRTNKKVVNLRGKSMNKGNKFHVQQTIVDEIGIKSREYLLPEASVMRLLTQGSTEDLMKNLDKKKDVIVLEKPTKKTKKTIKISKTKKKSKK